MRDQRKQRDGHVRLRVLEGAGAERPGEDPVLDPASVEVEALEHFMAASAQWVERLDDASPIREWIVTHRGLAARLLAHAPGSLSELRNLGPAKRPVRAT